MAKHILIVEDEAAIRDMVGFSLERAGFSWAGVEDAAQAREQISRHRPDLLVLDWMLPGISGIEFAKSLRRDDVNRDIPVIMLTARSTEDDMVTGLNAGADDFISKPFSPRELVARVNAVLRRSDAPSENAVLSVDGLQLDLDSHIVSVKDEPINIGPTEFRLLRFFMQHPNRVYSRGQLLDHVWGTTVYIEERTVDVHIRRLRKLLSDYQYDELIQTVRGAGYRFGSKGKT